MTINRKRKERRFNDSGLIASDTVGLNAFLFQGTFELEFYGDVVCKYLARLLTRHQI